jgi:serine O-acetyltransferase
MSVRSALKEARSIYSIDLREQGLPETYKFRYYFTRPIAHWTALLRLCEAMRDQGSASRPLYFALRWAFERSSVRCGFDIPLNVFGPGLSIAHRGSIVVNGSARVGSFCRLHQGVTLGAVNGRAPILGDGVMVGPNAGIYGGVTVGDGARVGPHAYVVDDVPPLAVVVASPSSPKAD